jgi:DNA-directed RNA polymerase specialized sigma subunit
MGAVFLILGWRWQYPPNNELLTAMKGMVHLKSEIHKLEEDMLSLNEKLENKLFPPIAQDQFLSAYCKHNTLVNQEDINSKDNGDTIDNRNTDNGDTLPEKYQQVLELADYDLTVPEISEKLGMSQDAVIMVMRTAKRRKAAL